MLVRRAAKSSATVYWVSNADLRGGNVPLSLSAVHARIMVGLEAFGLRGR